MGRGKDESRTAEHWQDLAAFYEEILHSIVDMILVKGEKSHLVWANKAFQEHYGMTNEELRNLIDSPIVEPDYTQQYVHDDQHVWSTKEKLKIDCEPVTRHDGLVMKYETIKTPVLDEAGEMKYTVGVSRDITEKISSMEQHEFVDKLASIGEMAGGVAHEINNPLTVIMGKARQLKTMLSTGKKMSDDEIVENLDKIYRAGERVIKIVQGLERISRDGRNDSMVEEKMSSVMDETLALCSESFSKSGIELRLKGLDSMAMVKCRPVQISQIILNLLNNAHDAAADSEESWVQAEIKNNGQWLEVRVWDSGPGIPENIETKIMQPFFTTKEAGKGTGLGLSISSKIAREHGGFLKLDRNVADSCFLLRLPLAGSGG